MKTTIYLRVAKTTGKRGYKVDATPVPSNIPLKNPNNYKQDEWFPTVSFAVNVNIPDELFNQAERIIAELNIGLKEAVVSTEISLPKGITVKK